MTNEELIKALRCENDCDDCAYHTDNAWSHCDECGMACDAADALEAADKRIAELERILKAVQENSGINFRMWQEAEAQLPKEGEWIEQDDGDSIFFKCSVCGKIQYNVLLEMMQGEYHYCPNCGAKMEGEQE